MANIGFSQRRTLAYLYGWTLVMAALALALRFVPYSDDHGHFDALWTAVMAVFGLLALAASVYLVEVLEILKLRQVRLRQLVGLRREAGGPSRRPRRSTARSPRELETGELPGGRSRDGRVRGARVDEPVRCDKPHELALESGSPGPFGYSRPSARSAHEPGGSSMSPPKYVDLTGC